MESLYKEFALSAEEWDMLEEELAKLAIFAGWRLLKMNRKNNHTDDIDDAKQELKWAIYKSGCYHKRQVYIENCLEVCKNHVTDPVVMSVVEELQALWDNRTRHGAGKVKYGDYQQEILEQIIKTYVPENEIPNKKEPLKIDAKFTTYSKTVMWNAKKNMGKKITREKALRNGLVSISDYSYLAVG